jgi:hypothetical protein
MARNEQKTQNAIRQAKFVDRQNSKGLYQVRGIYANLNDHAAIKAYAHVLQLNRSSAEGVDIDAIHRRHQVIVA